MDVCSGFCSVAVIDDGITLAAKHEPMKRGHVERLAPMVAEVLAEAGLTPTNLDGIAVTTGPGSFTGARLGVSFARGLALAASIPAVGISIFETMRVGQNTETVVALPGKNGSLLLQRFAADGTPQAAPADFDADTAVQIIPDAAPFTVIGTAAEALLDMLPEAMRSRSLRAPHPEVNAEAIARQGAIELAAGSAPIPAPLYVRPADAKPQMAVNLSK